MSKNFKKIDLINIISRETGFSKNFSKKIPSNKKNLLKLNNKKNDLEPIVLKKFRNISKPLFFLKSLKGIEFVRMTGGWF